MRRSMVLAPETGESILDDTYAFPKTVRRPTEVRMTQMPEPNGSSPYRRTHRLALIGVPNRA